MRREQCTHQCRRGRSCARAACLGHGRGGLGAGCGGQRARTARSPATLRVCLQRYMVRARTALALWHSQRRLFRVRQWFFVRRRHARSRWGTMARIDSGEVTMQPLALTSATRRGARRQQQERATVADAGPCAPASDPHANTQLAQSMPRRPVREAPLRVPGTPRGVHLANVGRAIAHVGAAGAAVWGGVTAFQAPAAAAYGYFNDDLYYKNFAVVSGCQTVVALAAFLGMRLADEMATRYVQAQTGWYAVPTKAQRARELGATEACLDEAVDMVTRLDAHPPGLAMDEGERLALARDLMHLMTVERSRVPPDLWRAASGADNDAHGLVTRLLQAARTRAAEEASTSLAE